MKTILYTPYTLHERQDEFLKHLVLFFQLLFGSRLRKTAAGVLLEQWENIVAQVKANTVLELSLIHI